MQISLLTREYFIRFPENSDTDLRSRYYAIALSAYTFNKFELYCHTEL